MTMTKSSLLLARAQNGSVGDDDIDPAARPRRRRFDPEYKLEILRRYDELPEGEKGGLLRREGLYSSHIVEWRRARDAGALGALAAPPGRTAPGPGGAQVAALRREKQRLEQELAKARFVMDVQAKLQALLEKLSGSEDTETK